MLKHSARFITSPSSPTETVVVAGASGFIGSALPEVLADDYKLIGLSRTPGKARREPGGSAYQWRTTDLFSRKQTIEALQGADRAIYLVHSLHPSARLTQGHVGDLDLICADNFARAAKRHGIKHIVYLSGIVPSGHKDSPFLTSRLEVEKTLGAHGIPVTTLRTAMVLGPGSNATELLRELVERLPVMALPRWANTPFAPVARTDLVDLIARILPDERFAGDSFDLAGPETTTFRELLEMTATLMDRRRPMLAIPWSLPGLSVRWMSRLSGRPIWQIQPIVESLQYELSHSHRELKSPEWNPSTRPEHALREAITSETYEPLDDSALIRREQPRDVRAVHRLTLPENTDARWLAAEYVRWLPRFFWPLFYARKREGDELHLGMHLIPWPLLVLEHDERASRGDRQLFWIRSGILARHFKYGRLEFRCVLDGSQALAAIHDFHPRIPWLLYRATQARVHHFIMHVFDRHLRRLEVEEIDP